MREIFQIIKNALGSEFQGKIYLCGGAVRDYVLGRNSADYDFVIFEDLDYFKEKIKPVASGFGEYDNAVGTQTFKINDLRMEYSSGHCDSKDIFEDAKKRDFTFNALYYDIYSEEIIDPTKRGLEDLKKGIIDTTGEPGEIFTADPSRMLRAVRFSVTLGGKFKIKERAENAIKENVSLLSKVPCEKTETELTKILTSTSPNRGLRLLEKLGILKEILPEVALMVGVKQNKYHKYDVWEHTLHVVDNVKSEDPKKLKILRYAALFHDLGKPDTFSVEKGNIHFYNHEKISTEKTRNIANRLRLSNDEKELITFLVENHMKFSDYNSSWSDVRVRKMIQNITPKKVELYLDLKKADIVALAKPYSDTKLIDELIKRVFEQTDLFSPGVHVLMGGEIMKILNLKEGSSVVGDIKNYLYDMVVEKKLQIGDKEKAKEFVIEKYKQYLSIPIDGKEIIEFLNIKPGKAVGEIISYLKDKVIEGSLSPDDKEKAYFLVKEYFEMHNL